MRTELKMNVRFKHAVISVFCAAFLLQNRGYATGPAPFILVQPLSISVGLLDIASLTVVASSGTTMTYQWYKNGGAILGATAATYSVLTVTTSDQGTYYVRVTNGGGTVQSQNATITVSAPPTITYQPTNISVATGQSATLSVAAVGIGTLGYQWHRNGTNVPGATASTLGIINAQPTNAGTYYVTVSNGYG